MLSVEGLEGQINSFKPHSLEGLQVHKEEFYIISVVGCKLLVTREKVLRLFHLLLCFQMKTGKHGQITLR